MTTPSLLGEQAEAPQSPGLAPAVRWVPQCTVEGGARPPGLPFPTVVILQLRQAPGPAFLPVLGQDSQGIPCLILRAV